jgi:poly(3-hydroxybutyrate) depolymerase
VYPDQGDVHTWREGGQLRREQTMVTAQYYPANPQVPGGGGSVAFLTIVNGGHSWPKVFNAPNSPSHCRDIDAADEIIRFWRREADLP